MLPARPHDRSETGIEPILFVLLSAAWGSSYLFIKIGVETLPGALAMVLPEHDPCG